MTSLVIHKIGHQKNYVHFSDERTMAFDQMATEGCDPKVVKC